MCISVNRALAKAWRNPGVKIPLDPESKLVIFSDLHRGVGDGADDFFHNRIIFGYALYYYFQNNFTYIELGDGDELYENKRFVDIVKVHGDIFTILNSFHREKRFYYVAGNHNMQMGSQRWLKRALSRARAHIPGLFDGLQVHRSLRLGERIFMVHGQQGDGMSDDSLAAVGRFWVRLIWKPLQAVAGFRDPTRASENEKKRNKLEAATFGWAKENGLMVIAGHTHRPMFSSLSKQDRLSSIKKEEPYYFNCGSGVHPRCVTGLEIQDMVIRLVKWYILADPEKEGCLRVDRQVISGCERRLDEIFGGIDRLAYERTLA